VWNWHFYPTSGQNSSRRVWPRERYLHEEPPGFLGRQSTPGGKLAGDGGTGQGETELLPPVERARWSGRG
jgi:hypothetical protein